jgi:hypothetical protein
MVAAKSAPIGLNQPVKRFFDRVSGPYMSKIDGFAMRAVRRDQPPFKEAHELAPPGKLQVA